MTGSTRKAALPQLLRRQPGKPWGSKPASERSSAHESRPAPISIQPPLTVPRDGDSLRHGGGTNQGEIESRGARPSAAALRARAWSWSVGRSIRGVDSKPPSPLLLRPRRPLAGWLSLSFKFLCAFAPRPTVAGATSSRWFRGPVLRCLSLLLARSRLRALLANSLRFEIRSRVGRCLRASVGVICAIDDRCGVECIMFGVILPLTKEGSSITIIGTPGGLLGNFKIELTGATVPGEPDPPIVLHYNVRLLGDKLTEDPVIVQNTWTIADDWGSEDRCPPLDSDAKDNAKVDDLEKCSSMVGKDQKEAWPSKLNSNISSIRPAWKKNTESRKYFPFRQGYLAIAILHVGGQGIHMTVDGKHVTSFAFREDLEPGFVGEVRIAGDIKLMSVIASGLPTTEDFEHVTDLETLKVPPVPMVKPLDLFIGIFSTANNFKRRMAVRRTWMQYDAVRSGKVAVRFFVGLHKNEVVNEELWNEARTYGDIQLMPFVDYYSLILWKTIAICIYGTNVLSAKYVMKTDDDAFVRVDEVLSSLDRVNISHGLLYGRVNSDSQPHRDPYSKWYITPEEWPEENYPPWAHGPGYIVSQDIAKEVYRKHKRGELK
ncbi:hypothetical protein GUJ93_ZPchr0006g45695, partial [Zizania palustris]